MSASGNNIGSRLPREEEKGLTKHTALFLLIQHALRVNSTLQIRLSNLAKLEILQCHFPDKLEVLVKTFDTAVTVVKIVVELHAGLADLFARTDAETTHTPAVQVERAYGKEEEEKPVVRVRRICDVPTVRVMVVHLIEGGRVLDAERAVSILTVQTLLVSVDHGLPVEAAGILDGAAVRETAKVVPRQQLEQGRREPLLEWRRRRVDGRKDQTRRGQVVVELEALETTTQIMETSTAWEWSQHQRAYIGFPYHLKDLIALVPDRDGDPGKFIVDLWLLFELGHRPDEVPGLEEDGALFEGIKILRRVPRRRQRLGGIHDCCLFSLCLGL